MKKTVRCGCRGNISAEIPGGISTHYDEKKHLTVVESEMNRPAAYVFTNTHNHSIDRSGIVTVLFIYVRLGFAHISKKPPEGNKIPMEA